MNTPPKSGIRIPPDELEALIIALFEKAGTSRAHAEVMGQLLIQTDLRGIVSHGTQKAAEYLRLIMEGRVNPRPSIRVAHETTTTRVIDGDGGMGHWPCYQGTRWAIDRAKEHGTAALTTRNHFHFGGASKYTRLAVEEDCIAFAVSCHRYQINPEWDILNLSRNSPLSFSVPAGEQPPVVPDMSMGFLPYDKDFFDRHPAAYFKVLGLSVIPQVLGGVIAGIHKQEFAPPQSTWESNQGSFIAVFDAASFMPLDELKAEMDRYMSQARATHPAPGYDRAELPGGPEWLCQQEYARNGIPIGDEDLESLQEIAGKLDVATPFERFQHTHFAP